MLAEEGKITKILGACKRTIFPFAVKNHWITRFNSKEKVLVWFKVF